MFRLKRVLAGGGATILEVLVGVAILGVVIGTASTYLAKVAQEVAIENSKATQLRIYERIQTALQDPDSIINSMNQPANAFLKACIEGGCPAQVTNPVPYRASTVMNNIMHLYAPGPAAASIAAGPIARGFSVASPTRAAYTTDGDRCLEGQPKCHWAAEVYFFATCPMNTANATPTTCAVPLFLNFRFRVVPIKTASVTDNTGVYFPYPADKDWAGLVDPSNHAVRMRTSDIRLRLASSCTDNLGLTQTVKQVGVRRDGTAECRCHLPKTSACGAGNSLVNGECRQNGTLKPVCAGSQLCSQPRTAWPGTAPYTSCDNPSANPPEQCIMAGYDPNGNIICINQNVCSSMPPPPECPCFTVDLTTTGDCDNPAVVGDEGYWLVSIDYGECWAQVNKDGKGGAEKVRCDRHWGRCCKLDFQ